jgi:hypothetical protein
VLPEPAGDGDHTAAMAVGVRGAAADITGVATAVGVMAHGGGAATIGVIERAPTKTGLCLRLADEGGDDGTHADLRDTNCNPDDCACTDECCLCWKRGCSRTDHERELPR